jgi:endoglucanase Acf2
MKYVSSKQASEQLGLHPNTLRHYANNGTIETYKTKSGQRRYNVQAFLGQQKQSATTKFVSSVESQAQNSETTLIEPSNDLAGARNEVSCENNTQEPKSSKMLEADSTISVVGLNPYWNSQCVENNSSATRLA